MSFTGETVTQEQLLAVMFFIEMSGQAKEGTYLQGFHEGVCNALSCVQREDVLKEFFERKLTREKVEAAVKEFLRK